MSQCPGCRHPLPDGPCASDCWLLTEEGRESGTPPTAIDLLQGVLVAACDHVVAMGPCDNLPADHDPEYDGHYCDEARCTYCALARTIDALPEEMKP